MSQSAVANGTAIKRIENSRLALEPWDAPRHAEAFVNGSRGHDDLFTFVTYGPFATVADFQSFYVPKFEQVERNTLYAIMVKPKAPDAKDEFAGMIGLLDRDPLNDNAEIGCVSLNARVQYGPCSTNCGE